MGRARQPHLMPSGTRTHLWSNRGRTAASRQNLPQERSNHPGPLPWRMTYERGRTDREPGSASRELEHRRRGLDVLGVHRTTVEPFANSCPQNVTHWGYRSSRVSDDAASDAVCNDPTSPRQSPRTGPPTATSPENQHQERLGGHEPTSPVLLHLVRRGPLARRL